MNIEPTRFNKKPLLIVFGFLFVLIVILLALDAFKVISLSSVLRFKFFGNLQVFNAKQQKAPSAVIIKVGNENIYQQDLTMELAYFPTQGSEDREKLIKEKLIRDSIILQAAQEESLITLDSSVYNSSAKNYLDRIKRIAEVKDKIESKKDRYAGSVVSVWFYNTKPGPVGYENGRDIALKKITQLHDAVQSKRLTMDEAAKQIETDTSLAQVDPAYKANAYFRFDTDLKEDIVFDKDFNREIKQLQEGQVSKVTIVKDKERINNEATGNLIDAAYMFAQVSERTITGANLSFDDWLARRLTKYEIVYK